MGRHTDYLAACASALDTALTGVTVIPALRVPQQDLEAVFLVDIDRRGNASEFGLDKGLESYHCHGALYLQIAQDLSDYEAKREELDTLADLIAATLRLVSGYSGLRKFELEWPPVTQTEGSCYIWLAIGWATTE